jgi:hypothetical protein
MDYIAANSKTQLLFVSHDSRDQLECITHELEFIVEANQEKKRELTKKELENNNKVLAYTVKVTKKQNHNDKSNIAKVN